MDLQSKAFGRLENQRGVKIFFAKRRSRIRPSILRPAPPEWTKVLLAHRLHSLGCVLRPYEPQSLPSLCRRKAVALQLLKHPRKTCCHADVRTSYPGITPLYWRAERSEWGAAGKDLRWFGLRSLPLIVSCTLTLATRPRRFRDVPCPCEDNMKRVRKKHADRERDRAETDWIWGYCLNNICPPSNKEDIDSFADLRGQVIHAHQITSTSAFECLSNP